ncbi:TPM domain-containing protein [Marinobacter sp. 71-i]|uniref:TPM domain-containing protein n=1 Tax=Marinobacter iranensis TaxID=2962607 RepID=A0ABT5Y541_9GAMM|nr:TPM domain-containing protein [Marinobacter iranensis]MDF0748733.1 TPM domain-containing protein [Marinobacter iranensis]
MTLLTEKEQKQVADAITEVEKATDAELVTVLAAASDNYSYIPLLWAGIIALLIPGAINYFTGSLGADWLLVVQWATFIVLCLLFRFPVIGHHLIPAPVRFWRASNMARRQFLEHNLHHTEGGVGMLIFVSEAEHYVEILVDQGIAEKVSDDVWGDIVKTFTDRVRSGETLAGFLGCIDSCGQLLGEQLPATREKNELPNHLVLIPKRS